MMRRFVMAPMASVLAVPGLASAAFINVSAEVVDLGAPDAITYRVYANFDTPTNQLIGVGTTAGTPNFIFSTTTTLLNDGGLLAGLKQEDFAGQPTTGAWDSYLSIGTTEFAGNDTDYSPGFAGSDGVNSVVQGSSLFEDNGGWFDGNPSTPELAGAEGRVIIAQFTIANETTGAPGNFAMEGMVFWQPAPLDLQEDFFNLSVIGVPAPAAFAAFGLAAIGVRRRRRA